MHIAIVGFDLEGRSSYEYFKKRGHTITVCDQKNEIDLPHDVDSQLGETYLDGLERFDLIVRTAGLNPRKIIDKNPLVEGRITTQINEFFAQAPTKHVIGITGTKGKGTTSSLTTEILRASGKKVFLGGNIGVPVLDFIDEIAPNDWVVLELSSFQLSDLRFAPHIATCLMVVPEHLNWHESMADYVGAKANLFRSQKPNDIAIYYADDPASHQIASHSPGDKITYYAAPGAYVEGDAIKIDNQVICKTDELRLIGSHNWQNVCAAVTTAWQAGVMDPEAIRSAVVNFSGLEHRLELVAEVDGVRYVDDSFGTTPETAIVALAAFPGEKVVILGGSDKDVSLEILADSVANDGHVRHVLTIGETGPQIADLLADRGFTAVSPGGTTMHDIMSRARDIAQSGDVVLLSPACASFGMFKSYKDRGDQFKSAVHKLTNQR